MLNFIKSNIILNKRHNKLTEITMKCNERVENPRALSYSFSTADS